MTLRAKSAAWFEIVVGRDWLAQTLQAVADTGVVELEACRSHELAADVAEMRARLAESNERLERFREHQPPPRFRELPPRVDLGEVLARALDRVGTWADAAEPLIADIETAELECNGDAELLDILQAACEHDVDLAAIDEIHPEAFCDLYRFEPDRVPESWPDAALVRRFTGSRGVYCLLVAPAGQRQAMEGELSADGGRRVSWPGDLPDGDRVVAGQDRLLASRRKLAQARERLQQLGEQHRLAEALGDIRRLRWLARHLGEVPVGEYLATITGWTSDLHLEQLPAALEAAGIPALVHLAQPPAERVPPSLLSNPFWVRPFEIFARQMGTPGTREADPSGLLAVIVPLLFGFMFGDVGQGLILFALGWWLKGRWPAASILIPTGASAMLFGFLYGSVFAVEGLLPALWQAPLEAPLVMLVVPLAAGALLMALGLALGGLHAAWLGRGGAWLRREAALLVVLVAFAGLALTPMSAWLLPLAGAWFALGSREGRSRGAAIIAGAGVFLEQALQLSINTLSFVRVGAFALAHAGLGTAVTSIVEGLDSPLLVVLVLVTGNAVIIALEGLVVSIQTTRLILFEFFVRFFTAEGRPFRPMVLPH